MKESTLKLIFGKEIQQCGISTGNLNPFIFFKTDPIGNQSFMIPHYKKQSPEAQKLEVIILAMNVFWLAVTWSYILFECRCFFFNIIGFSLMTLNSFKYKNSKYYDKIFGGE